MKHKRISLAAMALAVAMSVTQVYAAGVTLKIDGTPQTLQIAPINAENYTLVGMREIFTALGADISWDDGAKTVTATKEGTVVSVTVGDVRAIVNGKEIIMPVAPVNQDGNVMVPLRFVSEAFGASVNWYADKQEIDVNFPQTFTFDYSVMNMVTHSDESATRLTYDEALEKAVAANTNIQNLQTNLNLWEKNQEDVSDDYFRALLFGADFDTQRGAEQALNGLDTQIDNAALQDTIYKGATEMMLRSSLQSIANDQVDFQTLTESIALSEQNLRNLELKNELGMISDNDLTQAKLNLEQDKARLDALTISIADQKITLNNLLGYSPEDDIAVDYVPAWEPIQFDVEEAVRNITKEPSIQMAANAVDQAQFLLDSNKTTSPNAIAQANLTGTPLHTDTDQLEDQNNLTQAKRAYDDAVTAMEKGIRSTYNQVLQLEANEKSLEADLQKATDTYNTAAASFNAGMITQYDVDAAKLGITSAQTAIAKNLYNMENLKFTLNNPYLIQSAQ